MSREKEPNDKVAEKRQIAVAIGIVIAAGQVLICRRKASSVLGGYWEFPGGKIEPGETGAAAVVRELREELGITIEPIEALEPITHAYPHAIVRLRPFLCALIEGVPQAIDCADFRWIHPEELSEYRFPEANDSLLKVLAAHPRVIDVRKR